MALERFHVAGREVEERVRFRLRGGAQSSPAATPRAVDWQEDGASVRLMLDACRLSFRPGWLVCDLDLFTEATRRQAVQLVFFVGEEGDGDRLRAGATVHAWKPEAAELAERWGPALQRVAWDGVLDVVEGVLHVAQREHPGTSLTLLGFFCAADGIHVDLAVGEA